MYLFNRLTAIVLTAVLLGPMLPLEARTKKGDKLLAEGRIHEQKKEWDAALEYYETGAIRGPGRHPLPNGGHQGPFPGRPIPHRQRAETALRRANLGRRWSNCRRRYAINPGSAAAAQEIRRTTDMIERERKRVRGDRERARRRQRARDDRGRQGARRRPRIASPAFCRFPSCGRSSQTRSICA